MTAQKGLTGNFQFGTMSGSTMPIGLTYTLSNSDTQELLLLNTSSGPFYWNGSVGNAWNGDFISGSTIWTADVTGTNPIYGTPGVADDVFFSTVDGTNQDTVLGADFLINSLTISDTTAVSISGSTPVSGSISTLTIAASSGSGVYIAPGAGATTITSLVALGADQSWTNDSANLFLVSGSTISGTGQNLTVEGTGTTEITAIIQTGSGSLTKDGLGMLVLYGTPNTYSGGTNLKNGTLLVANANAVGTGNVTLTGGLFTTMNDPATLPTTGLHLNIGGYYKQSSPAILTLRILGPRGTGGVNDELLVTGVATLGGTFIPSYSTTGYSPVPTPAGSCSDAFEVISSTAGISGTFAGYIDPHYNPNKLLRWEPVYNPNNVMLRVEPASVPAHGADAEPELGGE